jgi:hypothetical protein
MVMEYCKGELKNYVKNFPGKKIPEDKAIDILK